MTARDPALPSWLLVWRILLAIAIAAMPFWMWIAPGGFPLSHPRFWANRLLPLVVFAIAAIGLAGVRYRKYALYQSAVLFFPVAWTAAVMCGAVTFPVSSRRVLLPVALVATFLWVAYAITSRRQPQNAAALLGVLFLGVVVGIAAPLTQRAPLADTRPRNTSPPLVGGAASEQRLPPRVQLSEQLAVRTLDGTIRVRFGDLRISIEPFLQFQSRSPDRCWTILAPARYRRSRPLTLSAWQLDPTAIQCAFRADRRHVLQVTAGQGGAGHLIDAYTKLDESVYSHLNTFCRLTIDGHSRLGFAFAPCRDSVIEPQPADYPLGRPARFAFRTADDEFRVVEASSGEKGPFRTLAEGPLGEQQALELELRDAGRAMGRLKFLDWAAQSSTILSPTAGWGAPVNAIEFQRIGDKPSSTVVVWMALAATSVGRGWDSVGHKPGVYRNRIECTALADGEEP